MRIAILGAGAVGSYFGGRLAQAGEEVLWVARGATLDALRTRGLRVQSLKGDFVLPPQRATDQVQEVGRVDIAVLGVKAWQVPEAGRALAACLGPESLVLPLQNGVDAVAQLRQALGLEAVVGGVCKIVCEVVEPGHVRHFGAEPRVEMGPWGSFQSDVDLARGARQRERCSHLQRAFTRAGVEAAVHDDIRVAAWEKFLFIASLSALGAATGHAVGELRSQPEARELLRRAMAEIEALARASGVALTPDVVERSLGFIDRLPAESTSSMQRDIRAGRRSELESQSGAVVRLGRERGIETPVHAELVASLRARVNSAADARPGEGPR
jgi:2-dehydropantoate 2-reductase